MVVDSVGDTEMEKQILFIPFALTGTVISRRSIACLWLLILPSSASSFASLFFFGIEQFVLKCQDLSHVVRCACE
jgi:hypothetical protein